MTADKEYWAGFADKLAQYEPESMTKPRHSFVAAPAVRGRFAEWGHRNISDPWRRRKEFRAAELADRANPERMALRAMDKTKDRGPVGSFLYNMIVNPGHRPGDTMLGVGPWGGQGARDRFLGSLATVAAGANAGALPLVKGKAMTRVPAVVRKALRVGSGPLRLRNIANPLAAAGAAGDVYTHGSDVSDKYNTAVSRAARVSGLPERSLRTAVFDAAVPGGSEFDKAVRYRALGQAFKPPSEEYETRRSLFSPVLDAAAVVSPTKAFTRTLLPNLKNWASNKFTGAGDRYFSGRSFGGVLSDAFSSRFAKALRPDVQTKLRAQKSLLVGSDIR